MSSYQSRIPNVLEAKNEADMVVKLNQVAASLGQKIEVMTIYHNASKNRVYAWYFHDIKMAPLPPKEKKVAKKKTKKVTKKA